MPYQRNTPRQIRRHVITCADIRRANQQVTRELDAAGFWNDRLEDVEVYWTTHSLVCYGWYQGDIYIPALTGAQLSDLIAGRHTRLTDILRHEWAHAVADKWPYLMESKRFLNDFDGPYASDQAVLEYDPARHLTPYAATSPCEDFAETFHYYLRHKGRAPLHVSNRTAILRKWKFVEWLGWRISRRHPPLEIS